MKIARQWNQMINRLLIHKKQEALALAHEVAAMSVATTSVPVGEQDVSYSTTITFALR